MQIFYGQIPTLNSWLKTLMMVAFLLLLFMAFKANSYNNPPGYHNKSFPNGCRPVGFEFNSGKLIFTPVREEDYDQTLYLLHNVSSGRITVKYAQTSRTALYPVWQTRIAFNRWAAFATDKNGLSFRCYRQYSDGYISTLDCARVLRVCQYPRAKFAQHNTGSYWISSSRSRRSTIREVIGKGILLRW